jgi:hypothetical protein
MTIEVRRARTYVALLCVAAAIGLTPATASLAAGDANTASCPNEALRGFRTYLPDCRGYEMVTPPYKQGYPVHPAGIAVNGERLVGWSWGVFAGATGEPQSRDSAGTQYQFSRLADGWMTAPLAPSSARFEANSTWRATGGDLTQSLWSMPTLPVGQEDIYVRGTDGSFVDVGPATPPADGPAVPPAPEGSGPKGRWTLQGASSDLSHVLYSLDPEFRWPGDTSVGQEANLYEYVGTGNSAPTMVGVAGGPGSTSLISQCGVSAGGSESKSNALSADGTTVFFTPAAASETECGGSQPPVAQVFARQNMAKTVLLSAPSPTRCTTPACLASPPADALFQGASKDGSKVLFTTTQQLTDQASEDSESGDGAIQDKVGNGCPEAHLVGCNLYEYDFARPAGDNLVLVSAGSATPHVQGVVRVSQDGSHVYFVAQGVLTATANQQGQTASAGADNLYVYEHDAAVPLGRTSFIATLPPGDERLWGEGQNTDSGRPAQATPDGRFLAFQSHGDLTPDDTSSGVWQVFEYDANTGSLVRVSIGQDGFNNNGNTITDSATIPAPIFLTGSAGDQPQPVALSSDGGYVFFQSQDGLTPHALNHVAIDGAEDHANNVYEYHAGNVFLISDGQDLSVAGDGTGSTVRLLGASESGSEVFLTTSDPLLAQDVDTQQDIYDARVAGGFASLPTSHGCQGEACQGALTAAPFQMVPGSAVRSEEGNLTAPAFVPKPTRTDWRRAKLLARALKACRKKHVSRRRARCEAKARRRYRTPSEQSAHTRRAGRSK